MNNLKIIVLGMLVFSGSILAQEHFESFRKAVPLNQQSDKPDVLRDPVESKQKRHRAYPMQPPTIPHSISNYQLDLKANKCLSCHARSRVTESKAPMVSVTHFMDRDDNFLADVSPRRYFCTQCHVPQTDAPPLVENTFVDMHEMILEE